MKVLLRSSGLISGDILCNSFTMTCDDLWHVLNCLFRNVVRRVCCCVLVFDTVEWTLNWCVLHDVAVMMFCGFVLLMIMVPFCSDGPLCRLMVVQNVLRLRRRTSWATIFEGSAYC